MSRFARLLSYCTPVGIAKILDYRARFAALNMPRSHVWRAAMRAALVTTRLELLPRDAIPRLHTVVDVGANVGDWSRGISLLTGAPQIIAFEPAPETFEALRRNTSGHRNIRCVQAALVGRRGITEVEFFAEPQSELSSTRRLAEWGRHAHGISGEGATKVRVPATTLDEALADTAEISLLKIDVQGGELDVLTGAAEVLKRTRLLMIEALYRRDYYEGAATFDAIHAHVTGTSPLRLWTMSEAALAPDGAPAWADAVFHVPQDAD